MDDDSRFLADEAAELSIAGPLPTVQRIDRPTSRGRVSGLVWGRDPDAVFLHGAALNAHTWDATVLCLARSAVAVDLPGHGHSEWWADFDYVPRALAGAVTSYLDALPLERPVTLVGHSLGGMVALAFAAADPERVNGLVLIDVTPGIRREDVEPLFAFLSGPRTFASRAQIVEMALAAGLGGSRGKLERGVYFNTVEREDGAVEFRHHLGSAPPGRTLDVDFTPLWGALESLDMPVTLVHAATGFLPGDVVEQFRERVPRARVVEVDSGHNVQEQHPELLAEIVRHSSG